MIKVYWIDEHNVEQKREFRFKKEGIALVSFLQMFGKAKNITTMETIGSVKKKEEA